MNPRPANRQIIFLAGVFALTALLFVVHGAAAYQAATSSPLTITKNHQLYDVGADILALQKFLNAHGYQLASSGPGSAGNETSFFGLLTYKTLVKFQAAQGLPATGYLGPLTRGKIAEVPSTSSVSNIPPTLSPASSVLASSTCTAPAGLGCVPGTSIVEPNSPGNGYTPGFGGGGGPTASAATSDTKAPTVSLTAPGNGATISGSSITLSATASDNVAVAGVQFKLDTNTLIGSEDTSAPYSITLDSTALTETTHTIIAVARDTAGNYATSSAITVTVDNYPANTWVASGVKLGVYADAEPETDPDKVSSFNTWLGRNAGIVTTFLDATSKTNFTNDIPFAIAQFASTTIPESVVWSIPIATGDGSGVGAENVSTAQAAAGALDTQWRTLLTDVATQRKGMGDIFRPGWEFNCCFAWSAGSSADYIAAYRRFVDMARSIFGTDGTAFDWAFSFDGNVSKNPEPYYPGDSYVDFVGVDLYYDGSSNGNDATGWWNFCDVYTQQYIDIRRSARKAHLHTRVGCQYGCCLCDNGRLGNMAQCSRGIQLLLGQQCGLLR